MKSIVLKYGLVSGLFLSAMTSATVPLFLNGTLDFDNGQLIGYTSMVLAFILVFMGIRSYRHKVGGGKITFWRGVLVGLMITLVTSAIYVLAWQIMFYNFVPDFPEKYAAYQLEKMRAAGASAAEVAAATEQMESFKEWYANPLINVAITFLEVFPVGLIVTFISAAILRKAPGQPIGRAVEA